MYFVIVGISCVLFLIGTYFVVTSEPDAPKGENLTELIMSFGLNSVTGAFRNFSGIILIVVSMLMCSIASLIHFAF